MSNCHGTEKILIILTTIHEIVHVQKMPMFHIRLKTFKCTRHEFVCECSGCVRSGSGSDKKNTLWQHGLPRNLSYYRIKNTVTRYMKVINTARNI